MAVPIIFFLSSAAVVITFMFLYFSTRHKERMSLIESGRDASIFDETTPKRKTSNTSSALKYGLFFVFIGFGVLMGVFIEETFRMPDASGVIPSILISGGIALLLYYKITKDNEMEDRITKVGEHDTV